MSHRQIIAIHMPKTGGTSLKHQISTLFDKNEVYFDYEEDPANPSSLIHIDPNYYQKQTLPTVGARFIYGHFPSCKYRNVKDAFKMTFLREPIDNVISIYNFWMLNVAEQWDSPLFKYFVENDLSIVEFSRLPIIKNLYSKIYFQGNDIESFDFVGDFKLYDDELDRLGSMLNMKFIKTVHENVTENIVGENTIKMIAKDTLSAKEIELISSSLANDIKFYERYSGK